VKRVANRKEPDLPGVTIHYLMERVVAGQRLALALSVPASALVDARPWVACKLRRARADLRHLGTIALEQQQH
jgi:hypothetical protein